MENKEIPASIIDHLNQIGNEITLLNAEMEMMEREGREKTPEYELLSEIEWKLCDTRRTIRHRIANCNW